MPLIETKGAASAQGFGGAGAGASGPVTYIEDVFSTWLYTGNGSTQTITNGIDLSTNGGLVWTKSRSAAYSNALQDTVRGRNNILFSDSTVANQAYSTSINSFNTTGYTLGSETLTNQNGTTYVAWTFREQPKFFDVVTYTGNGANRTISHNLGSVPGCIIVKRTDAAADWQVYHRSLANTEYIVLNSTAAVATGTTRWNSTTPTSTVFSLGTDTTVNANGGTYVAYLFAHNAGGFGLTGTDNVISCGSFSMPALGGSVDVNVGFEPQWVLLKDFKHSGQNWWLVDTMRGYSAQKTAGTLSQTTGGDMLALFAEAANAEAQYTYGGLTTTGFTWPTNFNYGDGNTDYIYIAIRRGPMKVPTSGTSVFGLSARTGTGANATVTGSAGVSDAVLIKNRGSAVGDLFASRLTGTGYLVTSSTAVEVAAGTTILQANPWDVMDGVKVGTTSTITNASANTYINYLFDRAPGFFDEVCFTGTGTTNNPAHNLGVVPELIISKNRTTDTGGNWGVAVLTSSPPYKLSLNLTSAGTDATGWFTATSSTFNTANICTNNPGVQFVAYLFATCPGVSKVGSYTGTGALQTVNCGFTGGARFVLIKRTDSTGDWYVYDSARGISSGNDPYLLLNSTAAEVTGTNYVDTTSVGFQVTAAAPAGLNASGGSFVFLAIA